MAWSRKASIVLAVAVAAIAAGGTARALRGGTGCGARRLRGAAHDNSVAPLTLGLMLPLQCQPPASCSDGFCNLPGPLVCPSADAGTD